MKDEIMFWLVVLLVGAVVGFLIFGGFFRMSASTSGRVSAPASLCVNNQRLIDHAKEVWAIKNNATNGQIMGATPAAVWAEIDCYIDGTNVLSCPTLPPGTHYIYNPIDMPPECPSALPDHACLP